MLLMSTNRQKDPSFLIRNREKQLYVQTSCRNLQIDGQKAYARTAEINSATMVDHFVRFFSLFFSTTYLMTFIRKEIIGIFGQMDEKCMQVLLRSFLIFFNSGRFVVEVKWAVSFKFFQPSLVHKLHAQMSFSSLWVDGWKAYARTAEKSTQSRQ